MSQDDKDKHAIRDEIERQLQDPPTSFSKWIEGEVERRVKEREIFYRWIGIIALGALSIIVAVWYRATITTIGEKVTQALSEQKVVEARERILKIGTVVEDQGSRVSNRTQSVEENYKVFMDRLSEIKRQDNVILSEDLPQLFVSQVVTNITGNRIVLQFDPIPETVQFRVSPSPYAIPYWYKDMGCYLEGRSIVFTNEAYANQFVGAATNHQLKIEYSRASKLH